MVIYRGNTIQLENSRYSQDLIGRGAYILDQRGFIYPIANPPALRTDNIPILSPDSPFKYHDLELVPNPEGTQFIGVVALRGDGLLFFAPFAQVEITETITNHFNSLYPFQPANGGFTFDIARGIEIEISDQPLYGLNARGETTITQGRRVGIFMIDGFGGVHTGGRSTRYSFSNNIETGSEIRIINGERVKPFPVNLPYFGVDVTRDIEIAFPIRESIRRQIQ